MSKDLVDEKYLVRTQEALFPKDGELLTRKEIAAVEHETATRKQHCEVYLDEIPTTIPYRTMKLNKRTQIHLGQRKLLLSEVKFLSQYLSEGTLVIYAGAAPGTHTTFLANLFKKFKPMFHLWDPREFIAKDNDMIKVFNDYFTEESAQRYHNHKNALFISDIRSYDEHTATISDMEERVTADMKLQDACLRIINPDASMMKFRQPYNFKGTIKRMTGKIMLQIWAPKSSSETRLISEPPYNDVDSTPSEYENAAYYFDTILRRWARYEHGIPLHLVKGLCHCFDCAAEIAVWREYLDFIGEISDAKNIAQLMNNASREIGRGIEHINRRY